MGRLLKGVHSYDESGPLDEKFMDEALREFEIILRLPTIKIEETSRTEAGDRTVHDYIQAVLSDKWRADLFGWRTIITWLFVKYMSKAGQPEGEPDGVNMVDRRRLNKVITAALTELGVDKDRVSGEVRLIKLLLRLHESRLPYSSGTVKKMLDWAEATDYLKVNRYEGVFWFNKERFEELLSWLLIVESIKTAQRSPETPKITKKEAEYLSGVAGQAQLLARKSGCRLDKLVKSL